MTTSTGKIILRALLITVILGAWSTQVGCDSSPVQSGPITAFGAPLSSQGGPRYQAGTGIAIDTSTNTISSTVTSVTPTTYFGDGSDGACVLDGSTVCLGMTPSSNIYVQTRDLFFTNLTVNVGVTLRSGGYRDFVNGTLTLNGTIQNNGGNASGVTGGIASLTGFMSGGTAGGNGAVTTSPAGAGGDAPRSPIGFATGRSAVANNANGPNGGVGQGGSGGDASGGGGGVSGNTVTTTSLQGIHDIHYAYTGHALGETNGDANAVSAGTGGGGGRGDGSVGTGGGGGGGGGWEVVVARIIAGTGAIQARGGNGANGVSNDGGGGGGGGGGVAVFVTNSTSYTITIDANGGTKGTHVGIGHDGGNGGAGFALIFKGA